MTPPPQGTLERWAWDYVHATELATKLAPPPPPRDFEDRAPCRRVAAPGRPACLVPARRAARTPKREGLRDPRVRGDLLHTFLHHELQAAELMCWAVLAFPEAPALFRRGLVGICLDEVRHMEMYREHMESLGVAFGARPVNDWFWERVPQSTSAAHFVATMAMGFEAANLDHAARFAAQFHEAGDARGAALQAKVAEEEVPHVKFGAHWFGVLRGAAGAVVEFDVWRAHLPVPLSPMIMRGKPMNREARRRARLDDAFLDRLESWASPGS